MKGKTNGVMRYVAALLLVIVMAVGLTTGAFALQSPANDFVYSQSATTVPTTGGTVTLTASLPAGTTFDSATFGVNLTEVIDNYGCSATIAGDSGALGDGWSFTLGKYKNDPKQPAGSAATLTPVTPNADYPLYVVTLNVPSGLTAGTVLHIYGTMHISTANGSTPYFNKSNSDYAGGTREIFTVTVSGPQTPATSVTAPAISTTVGTAVSVTATQTGGTPGGKFSANGLPAGLAIDEDTGAITGTPTTAGTGNYTVTYKTPNGLLSKTSSPIAYTILSNTKSTYKFVINAPTAMKVNDDNTTSGVQLVYDTQGTFGYDHVLIKINVSAQPVGSNPIINAVDSTNTTYNLALIGQWGPSTGFPITNTYDATTDFTSLKFDMPGVYTVDFELVDKDDNDAVICTGTHTITVSDYLITYNLAGGRVAAANPSGASAGDPITISNIPTRTRYEFAGWTTSDTTITNGADPKTNPATFNMPANDVTLTATWTPVSGGGSTGGGGTSTYTLTFNTDGGSAVYSIARPAGTVISLTQTTSKDNYTFGGWYSNSSLTNKVTSVTLDSNKTVYAKWISTDEPEMFREDHVAYVIGYSDGKVYPEANITRGEAATILFRLLTDESRSTYWKTSNSFSDVDSNMWYNNAVSTMANAGFIDGYEDGTFGGENLITRAEFAVLASRANGADGTYTGANSFSDISGHWAANYINEAASMGLVEGYADGTFMPDAYITRAEVITLMNRFLGRDKVDSSSIISGAITWTDNADTSAWYYYAIQEAGNSHDFNLQANGMEIWTKLTKIPNWTELEKNGATANSAN